MLSCPFFLFFLGPDSRLQGFAGEITNVEMAAGSVHTIDVYLGFGLKNLWQPSPPMGVLAGRDTCSGTAWIPYPSTRNRRLWGLCLAYLALTHSLNHSLTHSLARSLAHNLARHFCRRPTRPGTWHALLGARAHRLLIEQP